MPRAHHTRGSDGRGGGRIERAARGQPVGLQLVARRGRDRPAGGAGHPGGRGPVAPRPAVPLTEALLEEGGPAAGRRAPSTADRFGWRSRSGRRGGPGRGGPAAPGRLPGRRSSRRPVSGPQAWELANMALAARVVTALAARRRESRGAHWRTDYPDTDPDVAGPAGRPGTG